MRKVLAAIIFSVVILDANRAVAAAKRGGIRDLTLEVGQVGTITTAQGYSTLVEFDSPPKTVVIGDQDSFKVEYVGDRLAIKPLRFGAKTNLFVSTTYESYSINLVSRLIGPADYLVKVRRTRPEYQTSPTSRQRMAISFKLAKKSSVRSGNSVVVQFSIGIEGSEYPQERFIFDPYSLGLSADGASIPIEELYLEDVALTPLRPVSGSMLIKAEAVSQASTMTMTFDPKDPRSRRTSLMMPVPKARPKSGG